MPLHPIETVVIDAVTVVKDPFREELKQVPREFGTAAVFRTYDLPNTPNALIGGKVFTYDAADVSTPDNGVTCVHDTASRRFKVQSVVVAGNTVFLATAVGGGPNAVTATAAGMAALSATPQLVLIKPVALNTGAMTIAWNGGSAIAAVSPGGAALAADEFDPARYYFILVTATANTLVNW